MLYSVFVDRHGGIGSRAIGKAIGKIVVASAGMGAFTWGLLRVVSFSIRHGLLYRAALLTAVLAAATAVYFGLAWLMHCEELSDIYGIAQRKRDIPTPNQLD